MAWMMTLWLMPKPQPEQAVRGNFPGAQVLADEFVEDVYSITRPP